MELVELSTEGINNVIKRIECSNKIWSLDGMESSELLWKQKGRRCYLLKTEYCFFVRLFWREYEMLYKVGNKKPFGVIDRIGEHISTVAFAKGKEQEARNYALALVLL